MGRLHGKSVQSANVSRHRGNHAQTRGQADHFHARRAHPRRPQHRHHGARSGNVRALRKNAARHHYGREHSLLHDRLGWRGHSSQEAQPHRRRLAKKFHGGDSRHFSGFAIGGSRQRGLGSVRHGRHHVVSHHASQSQDRHHQSVAGRTRANFHA